MYNKRIMFIPTVTAICIMLTACGSSSAAVDVELTDEEKHEAEIQAVSEWLNNELTDKEAFTDIKDYQYYARTLGLDKDAFLSPEMWEVYYNDGININREIDNSAIYLIRLNPEKLLEIYAANNTCSIEELCDSLSVTADQLYYNWGYTMSAVNYKSMHDNKNIAYSDKEISIFGRDNGENRVTVMSTHAIKLDTANGNAITYISDMKDYNTIRRDLMHKSTDDSKTYDYTAYTEEERSALFSVNGIGIRAIIPLNIPNAKSDAADTDITVMVNTSPYTYGCTDDDIIDIIIPQEETIETTVSETVTINDSETVTTAEGGIENVE